MPSVNEEMELLIKLNDLELLIKEVEAEEARAVEQGLGFKMSDGGEREHLLAVRKRLRDGIRPESLGQFDRAWKRYGRALAPVNNGVCCGCFHRLPTSMTADSGSGGPQYCPFCARILYWAPHD
jgi:predicted  nucleic acid-binding Zn-ribbon protein